MSIRTPFRGTVTAAALLIDVATIGTAEARRRVLSAWQPDSALRQIPGHGWLLTLPEPVSLRAESAAGMPLVTADGGLAAPGLKSAPDTVTIPSGGTVLGIPLATAEPVDLTTWVDIDALPVHRLVPLDRAPDAPESPAELRVNQPDLRVAARIGPSSGRLDAFRRPTTGGYWFDSGGPRGLIGVLIALVGFTFLLLLGAALLVAIDNSGTDIGPSEVVVLLAVLIWLARVVWAASAGITDGETPAATGTGGGRSRVAGWWARVVLRSPAGNLVRRQHQRYLDRLTQQFERRNWEEALRDAIGLADGSGSHVLSLRLPERRTSLSPSRGASGGGGAGPYGATVFEHLRELYRRAADDLEKAGRIDEAAFVHVDLLADVDAAVDLLERHGRLRLAAELAEGHYRDPALVVRLWWRAGDRRRALEVARSRGAFEDAIGRLTAVDPGAARDLRVAWIQSCRAASDPVATVEAAWPDAALRSTVLPDIAAGMAMGGPWAAYLFAHLVTERPTADNLERALAVLGSVDPEGRAARRRFITAILSLPSADPVHDRQLTTAALRALLRDGSSPDEPAADNCRIVTGLRERCDPLLRADLPRIEPHGTGDQTLRLALADGPGALPVHDAAALPGGAILVAHGHHGVRLLTLDGRVRARWDVPAHRLVVADHGGSALLVRDSGALATIHRLDLADRRVRPWTTLRVRTILPSYDGGLVTVVDDDGLAFLDVLSDRPRVVWRELTRADRVLAVNRTPAPSRHWSRSLRVTGRSGAATSSWIGSCRPYG